MACGRRGCVEGKALEPFGLVRGKAGRELAAALLELPPETDSDEDGTSDVEELARCGNPSGAELGDGPGFGCNGARLARRSGADRTALPWALGSALFLAWLARRARRRHEIDTRKPRERARPPFILQARRRLRAARQPRPGVVGQ